MRFIRAIGALVVLAALVVGIPAMLIMFVGNPWPETGIRLDEPFSDEAIIGILAATLWILWAQLLWCIGVEIRFAVQDGGVDHQTAGTFGFQQQIARVLITSVVLAIGSATMTSLHADTAVAATSAAPAFTPAADVLSTDTAPEAEPEPAPIEQVDAAEETITVQRGDTLWALAEKHLGDGAKFVQIVQLNEGQTMNGGKTFRASDPIIAGWELRMPAASTHTNASEATEVEVQPGDSLSQIAEDQYGDGTEWPKIWDANKGEHFDDGRTFTDPDMIHPGWDLEIPGTAAATPAPPAPADQTPVEPAPPAAAETTPDSESAAPDVQQAPESQAEVDAQQGATAGDTAPKSESPSAVADDESEGGWPVRTLGGIGALLAAGVVALLATRRRKQQRNREPGEEIALPSDEARAFEVEVRTVADQDVPASIDATLRELAAHHAADQTPLPDVQAVRVVDDQIELYLTASAALPTPWRDLADAQAWARPLTNSDEGSDLPAPYPSLVTVGHDAEDGHVLLNVEQLQTITVNGSDERVREHLAAIAVELATAPWSNEVIVTLCGAWPELVEVLGEDRTRYVPSLGQLQLEQDRLHVVVVPDGAPADQVYATAATGACVITTGELRTQWKVQISDDGQAVVEPLGLPIWAQLLNEHDRRLLVEVLGTALIQPGTQGGQAPAPVLDVVEDPAPADEHMDEQAEPADATDDPTPPTSSDTPEPVSAGSIEQPATGSVLTLDRITQEIEVQEEPEETTNSDDVNALLQTGHPVVQIMAPVVQIIGAKSTAGSDSHKGVATRIATFLALNPNATKPQLIEAVWGGRRISANTVDARVSGLRSWLGANPDTDAMYLPPRSLHLDDEIRTDWAIFTDTVGRDPLRATTEALESALSLVQGRPLEGEDPKHYAFAEFECQHIISAVVDAAYELARRRYMDGRWRAVEEAAALGVLYEPGTERLWRIWIHAAHAAGNPPAVAEAIDRMHARISELGFELEPKTLALISAYERGDIDALDQSVEGL